MLPDSIPLLAAELTEDSAVFWRGVLVVGGLLALFAVWAVLRRRWARRSLEAWAGKGVHPGLDPLSAGILLRIHPTRLLAVALEPLLADGRVRIESADPLRLAWPDRVPGSVTDDALSHAIDAEGALDEDGCFEFLEVVQRAAETAMAPFSGRATAVNLRRHVARLWNRAGRSEAVPPEDRPWLLLHDPATAARHIPAGSTAEVLHDLLRLADLLRQQGPGARGIAERAHAAKAGYFRRRQDLDLVAVRRGEVPDRTEVRTESPVQRQLLALATTLSGAVSLAEPGQPFLLHYARVSPKVTGRYRGRSACVTLRPDGTVVADLTCSAACLFRLTPTGTGAGDPFRETIEFRAEDCPELSGWLDLPRMQERIGSLGSYVALEGHPTRLELTFAGDRDRFVARDVLTRYDPLLMLAEYIEERLVASGARGPAGTGGGPS